MSRLLELLVQRDDGFGEKGVEDGTFLPPLGLSGWGAALCGAVPSQISQPYHQGEQRRAGGGGCPAPTPNCTS